MHEPVGYELFVRMPALLSWRRVTARGVKFEFDQPFVTRPIGSGSALLVVSYFGFMLKLFTPLSGGKVQMCLERTGVIALGSWSLSSRGWSGFDECSSSR